MDKMEGKGYSVFLQLITIVLVFFLLAFLFNDNPVKLTAFPSNFEVNDNAIWESPTSVASAPPFTSGAKRLTIKTISNQETNIWSDAWQNDGTWNHHSFTIPNNESCIYWLNQDASPENKLHDLIFLGALTITKIHEGIDSISGQETIFVQAAGPGANWSLIYDKSARLVIRFNHTTTIGWQRTDRWQLYNTSIDLGQPLISSPWSPQSLAQTILWTALIGIPILISVIIVYLWKRRK